MDEETQEIADWLRLFVAPGQVTELRALKVRDGGGGRWTHTEAGYFDSDHLDRMAQKAHELSGRSVGVYFVFNPVNPALLARCANRVDRTEDRFLTSDTDVIRRRWLLIDADPIKPEGISTTDEEKAYSWEVIRKVREHFWALDWEPPVVCDSGNGYHLMYPFAAPSDDGGMAKGILQGLAREFDTDRVKIDTSVFNPARITKLYGTVAMKGDHTDDRPHRRSKVIEYGAH